MLSKYRYFPLWVDRFLSSELAVFPNVQFGSIQLSSPSLLIANLATFCSLAGRVDAIIGSDVLSLAPFVIDYGKKEVEFSLIERDESTAPSAPGLLTLELPIQGKHLRLLVDSGFPDILLFEDRIRQRLPELKFRELADELQIGIRQHVRRAILANTLLGKRETDARVLWVKRLRLMYYPD